METKCTCSLCQAQVTPGGAKMPAITQAYDEIEATLSTALTNGAKAGDIFLLMLELTSAISDELNIRFEDSATFNQIVDVMTRRTTKNKSMH